MNSKTLLFIYSSLLIFVVGTACRPQIVPTLDETQMVSTWSLDDALLTDVAETTTPVTSETAVEPEQEPAGQIERISDRVELGALDGALLPLEDVAPFYSGDAVRVRDGGEGLLDFGDQMRLRLFNESRIEMVAVESEPGAPLDVRMFLVEGGFTGELLVEGGRAEFDTPGGATIVVLGTDFYVASDQQREVTYVGNFGGSAEIQFDGDRLVVPSNTTIILPQRERVPLTMTREQFEQLARELQSPVAAAMTASATPTPTVTSTSTPRSTAAPSAVPTLFPTPSSTPSAIPTLTATPTSTETAMPTLTATPSSTPTTITILTATATYTGTSTPVLTVTPTVVVTLTPTLIPTATPAPAPLTSSNADRRSKTCQQRCNYPLNRVSLASNLSSSFRYLTSSYVYMEWKPEINAPL